MKHKVTIQESHQIQVQVKAKQYWIPIRTFPWLACYRGTCRNNLLSVSLHPIHFSRL